MMNHPLLVTDPVNIRYLTGFVGVDSRDAYVVITGDSILLLTGGLNIETARQLDTVHEHIVRSLHVKPQLKIIELTSGEPLSHALQAIIPGKTLAYEEANLTVAELRSLQSACTGIRLIATQNYIENIRITKYNDEVDSIRRAADITDQCFTFITGRIRPGVTEAKLAWEIESFLRVRAGGIAFPPIVAFGAHASQPHYSSRSNNPLKKNSLVLLDFGARVNGYCADMTRTVFLGTPDDTVTRAYNAVLSAHDAAIAELKIGNRNGADIDSKARKIITDTGLPDYPHGLGHGVGLAIHEAPRLSVHRQESIPADSVITIEPGTYIADSYGIRIEDLVHVGSSHVRLLSRSNTALTVL